MPRDIFRLLARSSDPFYYSPSALRAPTLQRLRQRHCLTGAQSPPDCGLLGLVVPNVNGILIGWGKRTVRPRKQLLLRSHGWTSPRGCWCFRTLLFRGRWKLFGGWLRGAGGAGTGLCSARSGWRCAPALTPAGSWRGLRRMCYRWPCVGDGRRRGDLAAGPARRSNQTAAPWSAALTCPWRRRVGWAPAVLGAWVALLRPVCPWCTPAGAATRIWGLGEVSAVAEGVWARPLHSGWGLALASPVVAFGKRAHWVAPSPVGSDRGAIWGSFGRRRRFEPWGGLIGRLPFYAH
ncbi:hypothetical protein NDU88_008495 [Pleurodeles waltl]|uniref:Uncharacterized protein n=1 Tax=Pleurodeles waltl TaxID=8319 RepID=A0AAV7PQJ2_PLEWA|nr:hypothetical protein NDU88_008495 [Pleurodeles waltl]